ncbi:putative fungal-specific transcription factor [Hypoxylon crocopeplum]|nr:putative fungal-specific transcription factor [Hypoxylon crocopeplum]
MSLSPQSQKPKRLKVAIACQVCISRKVKCDGIRPVCSNCQIRQKRDGVRTTCTYRSTPRGGPRRNNLTGSPVAGDGSPSQNPCHQICLTASSERPENEVQAVDCDSVPAAFAGEVNAAIDTRLGLPSSTRPTLITMTGAALFGSLSRLPAAVDDTGTSHVVNLLPPRKHADHLLDLYWQVIQPLEPFLDREQFTRSYRALYEGTSIDADERVFASMLNTVFALATQIQEGMPREQREEAANTYFRRAWTLLRPEIIVWEPGSIDLVQCLLLMSRYLQYTNNTHQTWMTVGSAVRIAQSLGLHLPESSSSSPRCHENQVRRQVWRCCVFLEKGVSWNLGRNSMIPLTAPFIDIDSEQSDGNEREYDSLYFAKTLELYEFSSQIMLSQLPAGGAFAAKWNLPRPYLHDDPLAAAMQFDACLTKWEKSLPESLRFDSYQGNYDGTLLSKRVTFRLRLLHCRILLFRPMLARFCLSQHQVATSPPLGQGLEDRLLQTYASLCVESSQSMIAVVYEHHNTDGAVGIIPWWSRVFYLHVAGTVLIAAMLRASLYTSSVAQSWSRAIAALQAHEHLSPFVEQCVSTFHTLSCKLTDLQQQSSGQAPPLEGPSSTYFQDVFHDMGFGADDFLFGKDAMYWLNNFEPAQ